MKKIVLIAAAAWLLALPARGLCGDMEDAKEHFMKGKALVEEGAYAKAIVELKASYDLNPVPLVIYNIAVCYDELQRYGEAAKFYRLFLLKIADKPDEKKDQVFKRIKELEQFIGFLDLTVDQEDAEVLVDETLAGISPTGTLYIETGVHDLTVRKQGFLDLKKKVTIVSGARLELKVALTAVPGAGPGKPKIETAAGKKKIVPPAAFWSMVFLTSATALAAVVTGAAAADKDREIGGMTVADDSQWEDIRQERDDLALATDVLLAAAGAMALTSIVLIFFTDFKKESRKNISFFADPEGLALGCTLKF